MQFCSLVPNGWVDLACVSTRLPVPNSWSRLCSRLSATSLTASCSSSWLSSVFRNGSCFSSSTVSKSGFPLFGLPSASRSADKICTVPGKVTTERFFASTE
ncbi:hypothetical protein BRADI_1g19441v3 [Brachypodium distachyon]|uniref:Uncharacterized protein n=1 Tax=Brachypodium distachyon TaxID=15368 RepID=A0A0Q3JAK3_BRADI|nr:hypothetical protein BRADI_1g19441v3 [Brachypodium distachyon]